jgi:hypothetical protein
MAEGPTQRRKGAKGKNYPWMAGSFDPQAASLLALAERLLLDRLGALSSPNGQAGGLRNAAN